MRCGLALDLPSASEEALCQITRCNILRWSVAEGTAPAGGLRTAERGRIRRRCMVHLLSDRHAAQVLCQSAVVQGLPSDREASFLFSIRCIFN